MAPLSNAERQRRYIARLKAAAAANGKQLLQLSRPVPRGHIVTNERLRRQIEAINDVGLSIHAKAQLRRLARHRDCTAAAVIEGLVANAERRVTSRLKGRALKTYYDGE